MIPIHVLCAHQADRAKNFTILVVSVKTREVLSYYLPNNEVTNYNHVLHFE